MKNTNDFKKTLKYKSAMQKRKFKRFKQENRDAVKKQNEKYMLAFSREADVSMAYNDSLLENYAGRYHFYYNDIIKKYTGVEREFNIKILTDAFFHVAQTQLFAKVTRQIETYKNALKTGDIKTALLQPGFNAILDPKYKIDYRKLALNFIEMTEKAKDYAIKFGPAFKTAPDKLFFNEYISVAQGRPFENINYNNLKNLVILCAKKNSDSKPFSKQERKNPTVPLPWEKIGGTVLALRNGGLKNPFVYTDDYAATPPDTLREIDHTEPAETIPHDHAENEQISEKPINRITQAIKTAAPVFAVGAAVILGGLLLAQDPPPYLDMLFEDTPLGSVSAEQIRPSFADAQESISDDLTVSGGNGSESVGGGAGIPSQPDTAANKTENARPRYPSPLKNENRPQQINTADYTPPLHDAPSAAGNSSPTQMDTPARAEQQTQTVPEPPDSTPNNAEQQKTDDYTPIVPDHSDSQNRGAAGDIARPKPVLAPQNSAVRKPPAVPASTQRASASAPEPDPHAQQTNPYKSNPQTGAEK